VILLLALFSISCRPQVPAVRQAPVPSKPPQASNFHPLPASHKGRVRLVFTGDINLGRHVAEWIDAHGDAWLLEACKPWLDDSDLTVANLECAVGEGGAEYTKKSVYLKARPKDLDALSFGGVGLVTLANNHILDYGPAVLDQTIQGLDDRGIQHTGVAPPGRSQPVVYVKVQGMTVAFLGFCSVCPGAFEGNGKKPGVEVAMGRVMTPEVKQAKRHADFVVVLVHWGQEYYGANRLQKRLAKTLADAGADLVIGSHPHVLQNVEMVGKTLVAYSLGNFVFDMKYPACRNSCVLRVDLRKGKDPEWKAFPMDLSHDRPEPLAESLHQAKLIQRILAEGYEYNGVRSKQVSFKDQ
jgi:poly-gamma-glutamate synthesis protein (capsule biosynthesis protein)